MSKKQKQPSVPTRVIAGIKKADQPLLVGLLVVVVLGVLGAMVLPKFVYRALDGQTNQEQKDDKNGEVTLFRHPLTGAGVYEEVEAPQVFSVMIDNHEDAWPPSGVDNAFLVVEAPVEAGISRMQAFFFEEQEVEEIGPVRSARPYFLDWANELDAVYSHVGGSNEALDLIASGATFDMNQYWWGDYFWRSTNRYAPHNVYTSTELLNAYYQLKVEKGTAPTRLYDVWSFKDPSPSGKEGSGVYIDFFAPVYVVDWKYDQETNQYNRAQYHQPHVVTGGEQISADNVVVVVTEVEVIDNVGRRHIRTLGEGDGYVLQDGVVIEATWKKPSQSERLKFYNRSTTEEITMNAGITWIEIVPSEDDLTIE